MIITKAKLVKDELTNKVTHVYLTIDNVVYNVPFDEANRHYQAYLEWAKTNTAEEAD
tara:strand:+ start:332 stop:502 length:171 start_codon:yes stop_codon:yes gene_type:complete